MAQTVTLPAKWYIKGTGKPDTISEVFDEQDRRRGHVLHKAAKGAVTMHELVLDARYGIRQSINKDVTESVIFFGEEEGGVTLFTAGTLKLPEYNIVNGVIRFTPGPNLEVYRERYDALVSSAFDWGTTNYPNFLDPDAYWDV